LFSPYIFFRAVKSKSVSWARYVAHTGSKRYIKGVDGETERNVVLSGGMADE
jgi:hypothetical protein